MAEKITDKLNELDAGSVTPQEFQEVWGISKEEYLNRMMNHIHQRKAEDHAQCSKEDLADWIDWSIYQNEMAMFSMRAAFAFGFYMAKEKVEKLNRLKQRMDEMVDDNGGVNFDSLARCMEEEGLLEENNNLEDLPRTIKKAALLERIRRSQPPQEL